MIRSLNEYASVDEVAKDIVFKSIFEHMKAKLKAKLEAGKTKSFPKNIDKLPFPSFYEHYLKRALEGGGGVVCSIVVLYRNSYVLLARSTIYYYYYCFLP